MNEKRIEVLHQVRNEVQGLQLRSVKFILKPSDFDRLLELVGREWQVCVGCPVQGEGGQDDPGPGCAREP